MFFLLKRPWFAFGEISGFRSSQSFSWPSLKILKSKGIKEKFPRLRHAAGNWNALDSNRWQLVRASPGG